MESDSFYFAVSTVLFVLAVFGTFANGVTVFAIARSKTLKEPFFILLMSLCVSDIVSGLISVAMAIGLYMYPSNPGNDVFQWAEFIAYVPMGVTSIHVSVFCILRFVSHRFPFRKLSVAFAKWTAFGIWLFATTSLSLYLILLYSSPQIHTTQRSAFSRMVEVILFALLALITFFTCGLTMSIYVNKKKILSHLSDEARVRRESRDKFVIFQLMLIVLSFYIGYIPQCVYLEILIRAQQPATKFVALRTSVYLCTRASECLNPIFYNISSEKLRMESKSFLRCLRSKLKNFLCETDTNTTEASNHSNDVTLASVEGVL